ncbi:MAG TPA: hypothetical protein VGN18_11630 [Jatrophihabitans sp.]|jgi:Tfp pilus assembly protein FimT|uniref:hypothetical protein n=1 Tax=Jatrophihabitans sp. TaxID=1932789 RepID=UPI002E0CDA08|nr:hypothetical protein [Jatrophihabitans sp.]
MTGSPRTEKDRGATLIIVLMLVTIIATVLGVVLSNVSTGVKSTNAYSDAASASYAADGAAQAALTRLSRGTYPNLCASKTGDSLQLGSGGGSAAFYPASGSSAHAYNATVTCSPDTSTVSGGVIGGANKPPYALLTLGTSAAETGQLFGQANKDVTVANGSVLSDSSINASKATLIVNSPYSISAVGTCTGVTCTKIASPGAPDPAYAPPSAPVSTAPAPVCTGGRAAFRPGLYTDASVLNSGCGQNGLVWFSPGAYYFDFKNSGSHTWNVPARVVGGTPMDSASTSKPITGLDPATASTLSNLSALHSAPGGCSSPAVAAQPGVEFVFGGDSAIDMGTSLMELCASYSSSAPPIAIYGLKADITNGGTGTAHAQSGCIVTVNGCTFMTSNGNGHAEIHVNGMVYAPGAWVDATYKNSAGQSFNWGLAVRRFSGDTVGSTPTDPFIELPPDGTFGTTGFSTVYLTVYLCDASTTPCPVGTPALRAKAVIGSTAPPATVTVLSWTNLK